MGGLDPRYANVVELQAYTCFDEVCVLAHKVEQQRKNKPLPKHENPKPPTHEQTFNKGSSPSPSFLQPTAPTSLAPQKSQTPQKNLFPQSTQRNLPRNNPRCFKCQGFGHLASDCTNKRYVTLAEWKAMEEVQVDEEVADHDEEELEEIMVEADEGDMLTIDTHHPPKGKENRSILFLSLGEPSTFFPTPPTPKALKQTFCQLNSKPLLTTPSPKSRASEEVVRTMFKGSPKYNIQISKGHKENRASNIKGKLFEWLIPFQPSNKARRGVLYLI